MATNNRMDVRSNTYRCITKSDLSDIVIRLAEQFSTYDEDLQIYTPHCTLPNAKEIEKLVLSSESIDGLIKQDPYSFIIYKSLPRRYEVIYNYGTFFLDLLKSRLKTTNKVKIVYNVPDYALSVHNMLKEEKFIAEGLLRNHISDTDYITFIFKVSDD